MVLATYWNDDPSGDTAGTPANGLPSVEEIRTLWCYGLPLTDAAGKTIADEDIKKLILGTAKMVERRLGVYLKPMQVTCNPKERGLVKGVDYEIEQHPLDYDFEMWAQYGFIQLRERPIIELNGFKLVLPNGNLVVDFLKDDISRQWVKLDKINGQINLVPYAGDPTLFAMLGNSGTGYSMVTGYMGTNLPQMIYVDYLTGYEEVPLEISNHIARIATVELLGIAGEALLAGVASVSTGIDGLSESFSTTASAENTTYGAHIYQYQKEIAEFWKDLGRPAYRGITMVGL